MLNALAYACPVMVVQANSSFRVGVVVLLELSMTCVFGMQTAKQLAEAVIPNEYGIDPAQKLRIASKICNALLGKLLADLANMKDESLATAVSWCHDSMPG